MTMVEEVVNGQSVQEALLEDTKRQLREARNAHFNDIRLIGEALINEADNRGWCEMYDQFIDKLNESLACELPTRTREYKVTQTYTVTRYSYVRAASEELAKDEAGHEADSISDLYMQEDDWTNEVSHDDTEVEEWD